MTYIKSTAICPDGTDARHGNGACRCRGLADRSTCVAHCSAVKHAEHSCSDSPHIKIAAIRPGGARTINGCGASGARVVGDLPFDVTYRAAIKNAERSGSAITHTKIDGACPSGACAGYGCSANRTCIKTYICCCVIYHAAINDIKRAGAVVAHNHITCGGDRCPTARSVYRQGAVVQCTSAQRDRTGSGNLSASGHFQCAAVNGRRACVIIDAG